MAMTDLHDVLVDMLKDLYNAEKQLTKALPRMAKAAKTQELRRALEEHLQVTENQIDRLEQVFAELDQPVKSKRCAGMEGLIEEGKEVLEKKSGSSPESIDAAIIAAAQKVEHYEIAAYGSARTFAQTLGFESAADLLEQTLEEEKEADEKLNSLAEGGINEAAARGEEDETEREDEGEFASAGPSRGRQSRQGRRQNGRRSSK